MITIGRFLRGAVFAPIFVIVPIIERLISVYLISYTLVSVFFTAENLINYPLIIEHKTVKVAIR